MIRFTSNWLPAGGNRTDAANLFLQHRFSLSDPAAEEALYDSRVNSRAMRRFVDVDLGYEPEPDETTICKFHHLTERQNLGDQFFHKDNEYLQGNSMRVSCGTIVDASIVNVPSSTKNQNRERDSEMHQTRKRNQWYFGMKAHIGVDSHSKLIHSVTATVTNVHDTAVIEDLLHGNETRVYGDSAHTGKESVIARRASRVHDFTQRKGSRYRKLTDEERVKNRYKSQNAIAGRTSFMDHEGVARLLSRTLLRFGQKCSSSVCLMRPAQFGHGEEAFAESGADTTGELRLKFAGEVANRHFSVNIPLYGSE